MGGAISSELLGMPESIVHILDDDPALRASLLRLCASDGLTAIGHETADDLLDRYSSERNSCIVLDLRLEEETGLEVQRRLLHAGCVSPIIFLTAYGTIPITVKAMRAGAWEFLTKPVEAPVLLASIRAALTKDASDLGARRKHLGLVERYESLTPREKEVLPLLISGLMNKQLAARISTSEITAKVHKRRVMTKMAAGSVADLARMANELQIIPIRELPLRSDEPRAAEPDAI